MVGKPKPKVKWLRDGEEIFASEEYQIENFEDGTSVLVINNVYPDDVGTISFEAYNPLGVAVTTALFSVEGIYTCSNNLIETCLKKIIFYILFNNNNAFDEIFFAALNERKFIRPYFLQIPVYKFQSLKYTTLSFYT